jgi:hypothetical protein
MFDIMLTQGLRPYFAIDLKKHLLINQIVSSRATTLRDCVLIKRCFRAKETNVTRLEKIGYMR